MIRLFRDLCPGPLDTPKDALAKAPCRTTIAFPLRNAVKEPENRIVAERKLTRQEAELPILDRLDWLDAVNVRRGGG